jgi:hypothetical protein
MRTFLHLLYVVSTLCVTELTNDDLNNVVQFLNDAGFSDGRLSQLPFEIPDGLR